MSPAVARSLVIAALLALWEILPRAGVIPALFLPPLSTTLRAGLADWHEYGDALAVTLSEVAVALAFACGGGILAGGLVGGLAGARRMLLPVFSSLYAVPLVVLYPVFTAWFGVGPESKVAFAAIYGFLPTMLGTAAGVQTIDPGLLTTARSMGATPVQRMTRVMLPAAIPTILYSLRVGGSLVIVGVVVSEMLTSSAGIGYLITSYRTTLDSPRVFAAVILVLLIGVLFDQGVRWLERATASWQQEAAARRRVAPRPSRAGA